MNAHAYRPTPAAAAVAAQLTHEMQERGTNLRAVSIRLGRHYETLRRYVRLERALSVDDLLAILDVIEVDWGIFMHRAQERQASES